METATFYTAIFNSNQNNFKSALDATAFLLENGYKGQVVARPTMRVMVDYYNVIDSDPVLSFGKHKGRRFSECPKSYREWLLTQDWFKSYREKSQSGLRLPI